MSFNNIKNFAPATCISGKIMRLNRVTANIFRKYLSPFKVTDSQVSILFVLSKHSDLTQKKLANITQLEKSSLHRNLKRLIERKYLNKAHFPIITLTIEGKKIVESIIPEWEKAMDEMRDLLQEDGENALNLVIERINNKQS